MKARLICWAPELSASPADHEEIQTRISRALMPQATPTASKVANEDVVEPSRLRVVRPPAGD